MRIGIVSDTHSRYKVVDRALEMLKEQDIKLILHCGDIEDAETVHLFKDFDAHFVYGNCDWDKAVLREAMRETGATLHEPFGNLEIEGVKLAWTHGDDKRLLREIENGGHFDYVFYGHTHQAEQHQSGVTRVVNPGALHRARPKSIVVLDIGERRLELLEVPAD
jgi:putative phosphoesterase